MKSYGPCIEYEPYTGQESVSMEEEDCGEYYSAAEVDEYIKLLKAEIAGMT